MASLSPTTIAVMRHLQVHGLSMRAELLKAVNGATKSTINNLLQSRYVAPNHETDEVRYALTSRGIARLLDETPNADGIQVPKARLKPGNGSLKARAAAMISNNETEGAIVDTLRRATTPITLPEIARRMRQTDNIIRPSLTTLVQAGTVITSAGKPATYRLAYHVTGVQAGARAIRNATRTTGTYAGTELQRNPGIGPERYAAFDLPSRMGNRLHYPDGRVLPA